MHGFTLWNAFACILLNNEIIRDRSNNFMLQKSWDFFFYEVNYIISTIYDFFFFKNRVIVIKHKETIFTEI